MTMTAFKLPIANIDGWLVNAVADPVRGAGGQPVPRSNLSAWPTSGLARQRPLTGMSSRMLTGYPTRQASRQSSARRCDCCAPNAGYPALMMPDVVRVH